MLSSKKLLWELQDFSKCNKWTVIESIYVTFIELNFIKYLRLRDRKGILPSNSK